MERALTQAVLKTILPLSLDPRLFRSDVKSTSQAFWDVNIDRLPHRWPASPASPSWPPARVGLTELREPSAHQLYLPHVLLWPPPAIRGSRTKQPSSPQGGGTPVVRLRWSPTRWRAPSRSSPGPQATFLNCTGRLGGAKLPALEQPSKASGLESPTRAVEPQHSRRAKIQAFPSTAWQLTLIFFFF